MFDLRACGTVDPSRRDETFTFGLESFLPPFEAEGMHRERVLMGSFLGDRVSALARGIRLHRVHQFDGNRSRW